MNTGLIVAVDDEEMFASSLKILFSIEEFNAKVFTEPELALEFIKDNPPALVISDFAMPKMDGVEFLSKVNEIYPEVSKIILTGYADKENAIKAINEVGIYKYIEKPWDQTDFLMNIKNGIERSYLLSELRQKISELEDAKSQLEDYSHNLEQMVAERTSELAESTAKLQSIFSNCADGIVLTDSKGDIEQVNQAFENILGLSSNHIITKNISEFIKSQKKNIKDG